MDQSVGTWILGIVLVAFEVIITTVLALVIKKMWNKKEKERQELEALREQQRSEELKNTIKEEFKPLNADVELIKKAMQKDMRRSLRQDGSFYIKRGYASMQEKTEYDELYRAYHPLGKNGVVDKMYSDVMQLPEEPKGE